MTNESKTARDSKDIHEMEYKYNGQATADDHSTKTNERRQAQSTDERRMTQ